MKRVFVSLLALMVSVATLNAKVYHVSPKGSDKNSGEVSSPLRTISKAAYYALAGDSVIIHEGVYREWVSPHNQGMTNMNRITFVAAEGEQVHIKGSEQIVGWQKESKGVWKVEIDNKLFGDFNPFSINLFGDWLVKGTEFSLGEVYLNDENLVEKIDLQDVYTTPNAWFAEVNDYNTVVYASFGKEDPNKELVEVNVRPTCFFPKSTGVNYITVKGLHISQAATQWSAPTAAQEGAIGPNWSKGWIIEDCVVSNSKSVGICLGKDKASGHNNWHNFRGKTPYTKPGFTYEIEAIFAALELGWSKENIGSHIVRNNEVFYCGQAGIVGHLGCAFSTVEGNKVHDICRIEGLYGHEMAGIKLHAAIDVKLKNNIVYRTSRGIWLDWQVQGTHVDGNIMFDNPREDLFVEVSHGPTLVYNNIFLSENSFYVNAQGITYANNIIGSRCKIVTSMERYTPYHKPHSTELKGMFNNSGGDIRLYNNIFFAEGTNITRKNEANGLAIFDAYPMYDKNIPMSSDIKSDKQYLSYLFPISTSGNIYFSSEAKPYVNEQNFVHVADEDPYVKIVEEDGKFYLESNVNPESLKRAKTTPITTTILGETTISEAAFENPDGSPFVLDKDMVGAPRNVDAPSVGPLENVSKRVLIWE